MSAFSSPCYSSFQWAPAFAILAATTQSFTGAIIITVAQQHTLAHTALPTRTSLLPTLHRATHTHTFFLVLCVCVSCARAPDDRFPCWLPLLLCPTTLHAPTLF